ncbi:MAG: calcium-binding protein [Nitrospiraceae bacterium]
MPQSQISIWLDFALQQMAAESYLDDPGGLQSQLTRGNNRFGFDPPTGSLLGATRFTNVLADRFISKYDIVDHHANDATGFSATLTQEPGSDTLTGGLGNDLYNFSRGDGQDTISDADPFPFNQDRALFGATVNPLDLVVSRQANDLRLAIHGSSDQITVQNWYFGTNNQIETIQAGNGQTLLSTQVDQLIQAMAGFTQQTGLTWDQAIDQQPHKVQTVLAASWQ